MSDPVPPPPPSSGTAPTAPLPVGPRDEAPHDAVVILIGHPADRMLGTRYTLRRGGTLEVGRSSTADVSLPDVSSISRRHALLRFDDEGITVEDLGSTNGTMVDDRPVAGRAALRSGSRFQVGAVHFKLLHEHDVEDAYHAAVYDMAMRDSLTQAFNRRKLEEEAQRECARVRRYARPLAFVLFDIDLFKKVNDTWGHPQGDAVLQRTAAIAREMVRKEQILARVGGEEFGILCPEVGSAAVVVLAQRLKDRYEREVYGEGAQHFSVTCSFGIAEWQPGMTTFADLYAAADAALYAAKTGGRNRVEIAPLPSPAE